MIRITCPECHDNFIDECLEHAQKDANENLIDPHRFYVCPTCGAIVDISDVKNRRYIYE